MSRIVTWPRAIVALLGFGVFALPLAFERLSPEPSALVDVRFLETTDFSLLADAYPDPDRINALVLAVGCGLATMAALLVWRGFGGGARVGSFFIVSAIAIGFLAVEEMFELTEALAAAVNVDALRTDVLAPVVGAAVVARYWGLFARSRRALVLGAAGAAGFCLSYLSDNLELGRAERMEDPIESTASVLLIIVVLTLDLLNDAPPAEVAT